MPTTATDYAQRRLGGGMLNIALMDTSNVVGEQQWFGITENLIQTTEQEFITIDNTEGCQSFVDTQVISKTTVTLTWDTKNVSPVNMAWAFQGVMTSSDVTAGTEAQVTGAVTLDVAIPLTYSYATSIVVKDETDVTTYVLGTDYTIDSSIEPNTITPITGGAITDLDILHIGYDYSAYSEGLIKAFAGTKVTAQLQFDMCNAGGHDYSITYHKADLSSSGDFSLKAVEDAGIISFTAIIVKLTTEDGLFDIEWSEPTV